MTLELGIFLPVANNGWVLSPSARPEPPTFELNRAVALDAERRGFHFLLAQSVWRGHGGATGFWDTSLECFTLMTALGVATERIGLVASVQPLLYPAPIVAKMVATADDITGGRFGINVVAGANLSEAEQMGMLVDDWGSIRYDMASEWTDALTQLWTDDKPVSTDGEWVQLQDCISKPKPRQSPHPPIVCAGTSPRGMRFAVEHGTHAFIGAPSVEELGELSDRYKAAAVEAGRTIKTYTVAHYLIAETDAAAIAEVERYRADPDVEAIADMVAQYSRKGAGESLKRAIVDSAEHVFFGGVVPGGPETIAEHVRSIHDAGLDGLLVMFPDWVGGMNLFCDEVLTRLPGLIAGPEVNWAAPAV